MGKAIEDLVRVTRIGLDLAKTVFQVHGVGAKARSSSLASFGAERCWSFSAGSRRAWWRSRLAVRRIIGAASSWRWVMR